MKLRTRIFLSYLTVFGIGFFCLINWVLGDLRLRYLEGVEESLVDQANILAETIGHDMDRGRLEVEKLRIIFDRTYSRRLSADIYGQKKTGIDAMVYITDDRGRVIFHSTDRTHEGTDYSRWNDVYLTLGGNYGARATRLRPSDPLSTVLYVSAPISDGKRCLGVLTVGKPTTGINRFMTPAKVKVLQVGILAVICVFIAGLINAYWLTLPIKHLTQYAHDIGQGRRAILPRLDKSEIGILGDAFEKMREALEGRKYVERYVQTFTHEIKSPLSAISGAAELLEEPMPMQQRLKFIANIRYETRRIRNIVDRMLQLSSLEARRSLDSVETIQLKSMAAQLLKSVEAAMIKKNISVSIQIDEQCRIQGDAFLLYQALLNLIENAIDFSPSKGRIVLSARRLGMDWNITIEDDGPGIPDYAGEKIFNRFFSLHRPDTGKKSTGLGLNFVKETAELHGGSIHIENRSGGGAIAVLTLPA